MVNDKTNTNVHRSNGNVVLEKNAQSIVDKKRTNLEILNTASSTRKLMSNIKRREASFLDHVMRKGKLEHLLTTGNVEEKRSRGRQRIKIQDGIAAWLGRSTAEMFVDARDRKKWNVVISYACDRHGNR